MADESLSPAQREAVAERAGGYCEYCRSPASFSMGPFAIDHIIPKARGGNNNFSNLAFACSGCNGHKQARMEVVDLLTGKAVRFFHPRRQRWQGHFAWSADYTLILGLTAVGRVTIEALHLNRRELRNIRAALRILKLHPPD